MIRRLNSPVADEAIFAQLARSARPLGMRATRPTYGLLRETYFDTRGGALRERRMTLCVRADAGGQDVVEVSVTEPVKLDGVVEEVCFETPVVGGGLYATLEGSSEVATRVRAIAEPDALRPQLALDIDREARELKPGLFRQVTHGIVFDEVVAHAPGARLNFQEVTITETGKGRTTLEVLAARLRDRYGVENDGLGTLERVRRFFTADDQGPRDEARHHLRVALIVLRDRRIALVDSPTGLRLPSTQGSGEELAHEFLSEICGGQPGETLELDLVGFATPRIGESDLEVWMHEHSMVEDVPQGVIWVPLLELMERIGGSCLRDPGLVAALLALVRSQIGLRLLREAPLKRSVPQVLQSAPCRPSSAPGDEPDDFLDLDLSSLDFNQRVLEMAEDPRVPLLERLRFLSIFARNMDEFFVVRVAKFKEDAAQGLAERDDHFSPVQLSDLVAIRVRALSARQYWCFNHMLMPALAEHDVRICSWRELDAGQRSSLATRFTDEMFPVLTPLRMSTSSVRSFPRLVSLGLALAAVLQRPGGGRPDLGYVAVPGDLPRFLQVPDSNDFVPVEEVIRANAKELFSADVGDAYVFRASRMADVEIDEDSSGSLLEAMADEVEERHFKPVIRMDVEATMPREVMAFMLKEIRAEQAGEIAMLTRADIYEIDGLLDLGCVDELCTADIEGGLFPPFSASHPLVQERSIFDTISSRDVLVHHPFHDFESTVGRFLAEAAADPDVVSIKLTLYRTGRRSPVMDALLLALASGKDVSVFVELKARFDEESNIEWTHRLKAAGAHVVTGVVGYKTHAKTALVVRREAQVLRRYVHIGTGNYNAETARFYTDLGLMSADPDLGSDLHDFFNELTGSEHPPQKRPRRLLVAPNSLVQGIERMIEREIDHAKAGRPAQIQAKLNGLADRRVVEALYRASLAAVEVDLVVRSICTLRPAVPGLSERIRVLSILGRFLEHSRIYYFENGGQSEYYIGSSDWRARNLRKRVEVVTPVDDPAARKVLRTILETQLTDPRAWILRPDGVFERLDEDGPGSQELFLATAGGTERSTP